VDGSRVAAEKNNYTNCSSANIYQLNKKGLTSGSGVGKVPLTVTHNLKLRQFHFRENRDSLWTIDPLVENLTRCKADCSMSKNEKKRKLRFNLNFIHNKNK